MTTIAYRDGVLAADSRVTAGGILPERRNKIFRLLDGSYFAFSGSVSHGWELYEWLMDPTTKRDMPEWEGDTVALRVCPDGRVHTYEGTPVWLPYKGRYKALGSGADYAYGALALGHSAEEAVRAAIICDGHSGPPVHMVKVFEPKKRKRK